MTKFARGLAILGVWGVGATCPVGRGAGPGGAPAPALSEPVAARLRVVLAGDSTATGRFYAARDFRPVWTDDAGIRAAAAALVDLVAAAEADGLDPRRYPLAAARALLLAPLNPDSLARLEAVLTGMAFSYGSDLAVGRVEPRRLHPVWTRDTARAAEIERTVAAALGAPDPVSALAGLGPAHAGYAALRAALERYRQTDSARARQIEINLERWRWLPRDLGSRYVMVNIAAFEAVAVEDGRPVLTLRAVVGRPDRPTPLASGRLVAVTFNPSWYVPHAIAVTEILPLARADPAYLRRLGFQVYRGARRVNPDTVQWAAVPDSAFPYRLVQAPGPANPLGRVRFGFTNPFRVALHDTPARRLLADSVRLFSHGCVRLERAVDLAAWLLAAQGWSADSVRSAVATGVERTVQLTVPVAVHLVYWTAWVDESGLVQFRPDVYGWDEQLGRALGR